jgi:beta-lactamase class A
MRTAATILAAAMTGLLSAPPARSVSPSPRPAHPAFSALPAVSPSVTAAVSGRIAKSGADVAVAFRTLDGRDELLIQPDVEFHAASTMKVPVMIELFRQARPARCRSTTASPSSTNSTASSTAARSRST